jgi:hypothetical protein
MNGFDVIFMNSAALDACCDIEPDFLLGEPAWDYYIPLALLAAGHKISKAIPPLCFHVTHEIAWASESWEKYVRKLYKFLQQNLPSFHTVDEAKLKPYLTDDLNLYLAADLGLYILLCQPWHCNLVYLTKITLPNTITDQYMTSYAQYSEDIVLYDFLYNVENGFYIDVAPSHPRELSATKLFYDLGWSGINTDIRNDNLDLFNQERDRDINCCAWAPGINYQVATTKMRPLNDILAEHYKGGVIHFLKIAAEHHEREVLEGIDLNRYRPWILVVQSTLPATRIDQQREWKKIILNQQYVFIKEFSKTTYYIAKEIKNELIDNCLNRPARLFIRDTHLNFINQLQDVMLEEKMSLEEILQEEKMALECRTKEFENLLQILELEKATNKALKQSHSWCIMFPRLCIGKILRYMGKKFKGVINVF